MFTEGDKVKVTGRNSTIYTVYTVVSDEDDKLIVHDDKMPEDFNVIAPIEMFELVSIGVRRRASDLQDVARNVAREATDMADAARKVSERAQSVKMLGCREGDEAYMRKATEAAITAHQRLCNLVKDMVSSAGEALSAVRAECPEG